MNQYRATFRDQEMIVEASNEDAARDKACEEWRRLHPEDRKIRAPFIAITEASSEKAS